MGLSPLPPEYNLVGDPAALERAGLFVAEGRIVVERLLADARFPVHSIAVTPPAAAALEPALARVPSRPPVYACEASELRSTTGFDFHRGCLALAHRPAAPSVPDLTAAARVLALEGVGNPDNVGGLFRTAFALGVDAVLLDPTSGDPLYRKAIRTSMAATLRLPFARMDRWHAGLVDLRYAGFRLVALSPHPNGVSLEEYASRTDERAVLLVGNEGIGLSDMSLDIADVVVRIPIDPRADSLNVVTAAAIALSRLRP